MVKKKKKTKSNQYGETIKWPVWAGKVLIQQGGMNMMGQV